MPLYWLKNTADVWTPTPQVINTGTLTFSAAGSLFRWTKLGTLVEIEARARFSCSVNGAVTALQIAAPFPFRQITGLMQASVVNAAGTAYQLLSCFHDNQNMILRNADGTTLNLAVTSPNTYDFHFSGVYEAA